MITEAMAASGTEEPAHLKSEYAFQKEQLERLTNTDLRQLKEDATALRTLAVGLKANYKSFETSSRTLSLFYAKFKFDDESQEIREERKNHSQEVKEIIISINNMLQSLELELVSSLDCGSVATQFSGFDNGCPNNVAPKVVLSLHEEDKGRPAGDASKVISSSHEDDKRHHASVTSEVTPPPNSFSATGAFGFDNKLSLIDDDTHLTAFNRAYRENNGSGNALNVSHLGVNDKNVNSWFPKVLATKEKATEPPIGNSNDCEKARGDASVRRKNLSFYTSNHEASDSGNRYGLSADGWLKDDNLSKRAVTQDYVNDWVRNQSGCIDNKGEKRVGFTDDDQSGQKLGLPAGFMKNEYLAEKNFSSNFSRLSQTPGTTNAKKVDHSSTIQKGSDYVEKGHGRYWPDEEARDPGYFRHGEPRTNQDTGSLNVSAFRAMSAHMLQQDLLRKNIDPFNGSAISFWPWVGKLKSYVRDVQLTPLQTLHLIQNNTVGDPHEVVTNYLEAVGDVSQNEMHKMWTMLERMFGTPSKIADQILQRIEKFPTISGNNVGDQLNKLLCLCQIVEYHLPKCPELGSLNYGRGLTALRAKLPIFLQNDWRKTGQQYEDDNDSMQPPFKVFVAFIEKKSQLLSNGNYDTIPPVVHIPSRNRVLQTAVSGDFNNGRYCAIHESGAHDTADCAELKCLPYVERKRKVFELRLCFVCLGRHIAKNCDNHPECAECGSRHATVMHTNDPRVVRNYSLGRAQGRSSEYRNYAGQGENRRGIFLTNCGTQNSFSKTILVEITMEGRENKSLVGYCILDECASSTLVDERVVDFFQKDFPTKSFQIGFADGSEIHTSGKHVTGLRIRGIFESEIIAVPEALSQAQIADTLAEVATPEAVAQMEHTAKFAGHFPSLRENAQVLLLIGRDCGRALATECLTPNQEPYLHKTPLGYALVGSDRSSDPEPLPPRKVLNTAVTKTDSFEVKMAFEPKRQYPNFDAFERRQDDEQPGLSVEDREFLDSMKGGAHTTTTHNLELPLPLKETKLPDNKIAVRVRTQITLNRLTQEPNKLESCLESMQRNLDRGYVEKCSGPCEPGLGWYLPIFCVIHPQKGKARLVWDASAKYKGVSLNSVLMQGPDLNTQLRTVLLGFREKPIAFGADVQDMFMNFKVPEIQRDYLRYFWFDDNNASKPLREYRATSHIFGCASSPAVANFALKHCAKDFNEPGFESAKEYIFNSFYVDDGLYSADDAGRAIQTLRDARTLLESYNIRLHKIMSNSTQVLSAFPESEWASDFDFTKNIDSVQRALGVRWDCKTDEFVLHASVGNKPFTKRGILSVTSSLFDPIGFISPVVLGGRLIQREVLSGTGSNVELVGCGWDDALPSSYETMWKTWLTSLKSSCEIRVPRAFYPEGFLPIRQELHVYCDASDLAIGHVAYMKSVDVSKASHVAIVTGSSRVAPRNATSIPRLELCAAMEAAKAATTIMSELRVKPDQLFLYSDSQIVLGYLNNLGKRFEKYVERRVAIILNQTSPSSWYYVGTKENPADLASRPHTTAELLNSSWFTGPEALYSSTPPKKWIPLPEVSLPGERAPTILLHTTTVKENEPFLDGLFARVSQWKKLIGIVRILLIMKNKVDQIRQSFGHAICPRSDNPSEELCIIFLVKQVQRSCFPREIQLLENGKALPESSPVADLSPFLDDQGVLCVGGRLRNSSLPQTVKHPYLLPQKHPVSNSLVMQVHRISKHQGSHITHGALIQSGFHVIKGRSVVRELLKDCIFCKKLRGRTETQIMADLPSERLECIAPFSNVGIDVFGPFYIHDGRQTRKTAGSKKIWVLICVCMPSRAIHLEPLVSMDTSSFRNALVRFEALRGKVQSIRSDQGSNFVAAKRQLGELEISKIKEDLGTSWQLNPPHASHHGGSWERKIGSVRRVLESSMAVVSNKCLSRDEFATFIAEASAVVNNSPLWSRVSSSD